MIQIEIKGDCGQGKTCLALLLCKIFEDDLNFRVIYENPDAPNCSRSFLTEQELRTKYRECLKGLTVYIKESAVSIEGNNNEGKS